MLRLTALIPLLSLLAGCSALGLSADETDGFILNERLAEAYRNPDYALQRGRAPLVMRSGRSVDNCVTYLQEGGHGAVAADVNSRITPGQYLICDSLAALRNARPQDEDAWRPDTYGQALHDRLDLRTFDSSLRELVDGDDHQLAQLEGLAAKITDRGVAVDAREWFLHLETVAVGLINDNDQPDWLVWLFDQSNSGMYRSYQLLLIEDVAASGPLRATPYQP